MISRTHRFHGHHAVSRVRGASMHGELFSVRAQPSNRRSYRAAVVVSKKVAASAVVRNRIRRRLYERLRVEPLLQHHAVDVVLYVKQPQVATILSEELDRALSELLKKSIK